MPRLFNSTIRVQKKQLSCGHYDYDFSRGRCKQCAVLDKMRNLDKQESELYVDINGLIQDADALVSRYVRLSAANEHGLVKCFTCPIYWPWKEMDAGHYVPRACLFLRHDLRNIKPQCRDCNRLMHGRPATYSVNLELLQPGLVDQLISESRIIHNVSSSELRAIISDMTEKLSRIKTPVL